MIHRLAARLVYQSARRGIKLPREDVFQELSILWIECSRKFDPDRGVAFATYYWRAVSNERQAIINRLCGKDAGLRTDSANSYLISLNSGEITTGKHSMQSFLEHTTDLATPEAAFIRKENIQRHLRDNPLFAKLTEIVMNPPPEIMEQVKLLRAKAEWAEQQGLSMTEQDREATQVTISMLINLFQLNWQHRRMMKNIMEGASA